MSQLVESLWDRFGSLTVADIPVPARTVASQCILDWYACALAGSREPGPRLLVDEVAGVPGPASIVGTTRRTGVLQAALVNGAAGHALDFDDTSTVMSGHGTVPVFPAVLALAEERQASGSEVLAAFVTGVEVEMRLAIAIGSSHYARGWHVTSTIGVLGAAAAASRLLRLDADRAAHALGLAASQASGLKANFGTMTKPFHAGHAAERGLLSARLAARGFTANPEAFSASQGFAQAAADGELRLDRVARHQGDWLIVETLFKYHAACYLTHAAIEAAGSLRPQLDGRPIEAVTVTVHPSVLDVCAIPRPTTGLEAKFSLAATTAFALLGFDTTDIDTYGVSALSDSAVQRLVEVVAVETDGSLPTTASRVEVRTTGGVHGASFDTGVPATDLDAQGARLHAKFVRLATPVIGPDGVACLAADLAALTDLAGVQSIWRPPA